MTAVKDKYFVFSDESGSWHDPNDIYIRAWVIVPESEHGKLVDAINYVSSDLGCTEVKWKTIAANPHYSNLIEKFDFRLFLTISSPGDIEWATKYKITRDFSTQVETLDFGELDIDIVKLLKKKMFDDIRNILFLKFYEKTHISNAKEGIDRVLPHKDNLLVYRVDPPQMSKDGWKDILKALAPEVQIEFPKSQTDEGIQFADIVAGCIRSFILEDSWLEQARTFIPLIRKKFIDKNVRNPNPNLIFFDEIRSRIKIKCGELWSI